MIWKNWQVSALAALFTLAVLCGVRGDDVKPSDEGKAAEFKGKTFDLKEKDEAAILLTCTAGKEITATTKGEKETDVHLFIYSDDKKEIGKDTSPGPKCEVKFTPAKDGKFKFLVRNRGPGANKVTLEVKVASDHRASRGSRRPTGQDVAKRTLSRRLHLTGAAILVSRDVFRCRWSRQVISQAICAKTCN